MISIYHMSKPWNDSCCFPYLQVGVAASMVHHENESIITIESN